MACLFFDGALLHELYRADKAEASSVKDAFVDWATAKLAAASRLYLSFLLVSLIALLGYHLRLVALGETTNERVKGVWKGQRSRTTRGCCGELRPVAARASKATVAFTEHAAARAAGGGVDACC